MLRSIFFTVLLSLSVTANAGIIPIDFGNNVQTVNIVNGTPLEKDNILLVENISIDPFSITPQETQNGIFLYDGAIKISMLDGSLFNLIDLSWINEAIFKVDSGVVYNDSNFETFDSKLITDGNYLDQSFFGSFGQNVSYIDITSYPSGHKVLDSITIETVQVPEPNMLALFGFGLAGMLSFRKKKAV
jgi:hypothetical protein